MRRAITLPLAILSNALVDVAIDKLDGGQHVFAKVSYDDCDLTVIYKYSVGF